MNINSYKTSDLSFAAFLKTRGWHVQGLSSDEPVKEIVFQVPGWDTSEKAVDDFKADSEAPARSLLANYHYVKNMVTRRQRGPDRH